MSLQPNNEILSDALFQCRCSQYIKLTQYCDEILWPELKKIVLINETKEQKKCRYGNKIIISILIFQYEFL